MDQAFVPVKTSKLIVRVKLDNDFAPPIEQETDEKTGLNRNAIFVVALVVLLLAAATYYYFLSSNEAAISAEIEVEMPAAKDEMKNSTTAEAGVPLSIPVLESPSIVETALPPETKAIEITKPEIIIDGVEARPVKLPEPELNINKISEPLVEPVLSQNMPDMENQVIPSKTTELIADANVAPDFSINVPRAQFTYGIKSREPIDLVEETVPVKTNGIEKIYFFTELKNLKGQAIRHQWFHDGKLISEITFNVRGNRWRVNSSKRLSHSAQGFWEVSVVNEAGDVLISDGFEYK